MVYHTDWFADKENSLYHWGKSHLIMVYAHFNDFNIFLKWACQYFVENVYIYVQEQFWSVIFVWYLCLIWYQGDGGLIEWVWNFLFSGIVCNSFRNIGVNSSLNVWQNSPVKPSGSRLLFIGSFYNTYCFSTGNLFIFSICSWLSLGSLSISSRLASLLGYNCSWSFIFLCVGYTFSFFKSNFIDLPISLYFLIDWAKCLTVIFSFSKN